MSGVQVSVLGARGDAIFWRIFLREVGQNNLTYILWFGFLVSEAICSTMFAISTSQELPQC